MENENKDINNTLKESSKAISTSLPGKSKFEFSSFQNNLIPLIEDFISYRKQIKKPFKTQKGVTTFYNELMALSKGDYSEAVKLIDHAKGKEWQTVYAIDKKQDAIKTKYEETIELFKS